MKKILEEFRSRYDGILGSLVLDSAGQVVENEIPSFLEFDSGLVARELMGMYTAMQPLLRSPGNRQLQTSEHDIILYFDSIIISCRVIKGGYFLILAQSDASIVKISSLARLSTRTLELGLQKPKGV